MDIPKKFYNSLEDQPFVQCQMCSSALLDGNKEYLIEKAFRRFPNNNGEELLFEVAICLECAQKMRTKLSRESLQNIEKFLSDKGMEQQLNRLSDQPYDPLQTCLLSGTTIGEMQEYQIYAHCRGRHLTMDRSFYLLSDVIIEEMQGLLSKETRDELNRFTDDNFGMPPELRRLFSNGDLIHL